MRSTISARSMKYRVEITPTAEAEVEEAFDYIYSKSPQNAEKWRKGLYDVAATLDRFPEGCSFALENDSVDFDVRQKLYGRYRILFTVMNHRVIVLHVRHAARRAMESEEL